MSKIGCNHYKNWVQLCQKLGATMSKIGCNYVKNWVQLCQKLGATTTKIGCNYVKNWVQLYNVNNWVQLCQKLWTPIWSVTEMIPAPPKYTLYIYQLYVQIYPIISKTYKNIPRYTRYQAAAGPPRPARPRGAGNWVQALQKLGATMSKIGCNYIKNWVQLWKKLGAII